ncbi:MAG: hypothetical protein ACJ741_04375 [Pyrinomonadaceae bacterium]
MAQIDWDALSTVDDWSNALKTLIGEAKAAVQNNDSDARLTTQASLTDFITNSPSFCAPLDAVARDTARDLFNSEVNAALASLASRDADLAKATAAIQGATAHADQSAKSIQFKQAIDFLDKSKAALAQLKTLEEQLVSPDTDLLAKIKAVLAAIDELKSAKEPS